MTMYYILYFDERGNEDSLLIEAPNEKTARAAVGTFQIIEVVEWPKEEPVPEEAP